MKNQPGIDLADLSQAQRKMCVKLLALNNVEFVQNKDSYTATLSVPTSEVHSYLANTKTGIKAEKLDKQNQQKCLTKLKNKNSQGQKSSSTLVTAASPKPITRANTNANMNLNIKQKSSKKPLFKATKLPNIAALQTLHPEVQIYVHAKKIPILSLQQQIEWVYQMCWTSRNCEIIAEHEQRNNTTTKLRQIPLQPKSQHSNEYSNLVKLYYQTASQLLASLPTANNAGNAMVKSTKNQQNLVNSLQTINHYQHRDVGVRIFYKFLSNQYTQEQFAYFLVLRALMQQIVGDKIVGIKSYSQASINNNNNNNYNNNNNNRKNSTFSNNSAASIITFNNAQAGKNGRVKFKWNPFQKQISEHTCRQFLGIVIPASRPSNSADSDRHNDATKIFEKLTERMYYCETRRANYIRYCDLMEYLIEVFAEECSHYSVTNLEFSYSHNADSVSHTNQTLEGMFAQRSQRPLQTVFQMQLKPIQQQDYNKRDSKLQEDSLEEHSNTSNSYTNNNASVDEGNCMASDLMNLTQQKCTKMCTNLQIPSEHHSQIHEKMRQCIDSIISMDKIKWVAALDIEGNEKELNFIQNLQKEYRQLIQSAINNKTFNQGKPTLRQKQSVSSDRISLGNMLLRRIFGGPGVMRLFNTKVQF